MTIADLVASLGLQLLERPVVNGRSMTLTVVRSQDRRDLARARTFNVPYPLTDRAAEVLKNALATW
jgi:hypothetical protein